ncbi:MAG TPA: DNA gyrase modulator, partial [Candidatus Saccharimonadales bacterium]|nr:DNA gyrase modulator [Candidatus Saccharimonadales bacterium]
MSVTDLLDRAESAVRTALRAGADAAEAYLVGGRSTEIRVRGGRIERTVRSDGMGCGLRVDRGRRQGFASSTDLSPAGIRALAASAISLSRFAPEDPDVLIPEVKGADGGVEPSDDLDDPELHGLSFERATEIARR